jgi:hypothetical protein
MVSIPIARSINLVDSVALPLLRLENGANWPEFWTQVGPKFYLADRHLSADMTNQNITAAREVARLGSPYSAEDTSNRRKQPHQMQLVR